MVETAVPVVDDVLLESKKELELKIKAHLEAGKPLMHVIGAFGDREGCVGVIEGDPIFPPEGGTFIKLYGCPYLLTGFPERSMVEWFGLPKAMVSALPREFLAKDWLEVAKFIFDGIFRRKLLIHKAHVYFSTIYANFLKKIPIEQSRYNKVSKELKRAVHTTLERASPSDMLHQDYDVVAPKRELLELIANVNEFFCYLLEFDSAYRFPFQDVFGEVDKEAFRKSTPKAVAELLNKMSDRWQVVGLKSKPKLILRMLLPLLYLSSTLRNFIRDVVMELDLEKIKMNEDDWYFCLEREQYNYKGMSFEERMKIRAEMDKKGKVVRLKIYPRTDGGIDIHL